MKPWGRVVVTAAAAVAVPLMAAAGLALLLPRSGGAEENDLKVEGIFPVESRRVTRALFDFICKAQVFDARTGAAFGSTRVKARLTSLSPSTTVIDGELTIGNVPAGGRAVSEDTFTIRQDRTQPFDPGSLVWEVTGERDLPVPDGWAGEWQVTITYRSVRTGSVVAVDEVRDVICSRDSVGAALFGRVAGCAGSSGAGRVQVACSSSLDELGCSLRGSFDLSVEVVGDAMTGSGQWNVTVEGACAGIQPGAEEIEVQGVRVGPAAAGCEGAPGRLVEKFNRSWPLGLVSGQ